LKTNSKTGQKPEYHEWTTAELFACLKNNHEIDPDDTFEKWANDRADLLKMAEDLFEN
jgi:hypothetical protein